MRINIPFKYTTAFNNIGFNEIIIFLFIILHFGIKFTKSRTNEQTHFTAEIISRPYTACLPLTMREFHQKVNEHLTAGVLIV